MTDTTDEDQHPDQAAEDPRTDPASVAHEIDDMEDLILAAQDAPTPPPERLEDGATDPSNADESNAGGTDVVIGSAEDGDSTDDAESADDAGSTDDAETADNAGSTDDAEVAGDAGSTEDPRAGDEGTDTDESVVDDEPETPAEPMYRWFDCTGDDAQVALDAAEAARDALENGELVVLPTDTVYGIGADAFNADAVQRLLDAKVRGRDMPPPVLIADANLMQALVVDVPEGVEALVARHWPGALTVICKARTTLKMDLGETEGTVALRVPDHDLTREVLRQTGPLAVSSANLSGLPAALTCEDALDQLGGSIAVYLDVGALGGGTGAPSTIVDFTQDDRGEVLRHGALSLEVLRETLPDVVDLVEPEADASSEDPDDDAGPTSPEFPDAPESSDAPEPPDAVDSTDPTNDAEPTGGAEPTNDAKPTNVTEPTTLLTVPTPAAPEPIAEPTPTQQDLDAVAAVDWDAALNDQAQSEDDELTYGEADEHERHDGLADDGTDLAHPAEGAEPTTDDLRITHADVDPDQPNLFEQSEESHSSAGTSARTLQPPTGP